MARFSLPLRLLVLLVASILPAMAALAYVQLGLRHERTGRVFDSAKHQSQLLAANVETIIDGARQLTLVVAKLDAIRMLAPACGDELRALRDGLGPYALLEVVTADGQVVCTTGTSGDTGLQASVATAMQSGHFTIGRYTLLADGGAVLPTVQPFAGPNGQRGAVVAAIDLNWLEQHLHNFRYNAANSINVSDNQGTILVREPDNQRWRGTQVVAAAQRLINAPQAGVQPLSGLDGMRRIVGYVPAPLTGGLYVSYGVYMPVLMAAIDQAAWRGYALVAVCAVLTALMMMQITRRLVHAPTEALLDAAQRWTAGDLSARATLQVPEGSEFARIGDAYNAMAEKLSARRRQMEEVNTSLEARVAERTQALSDINNRLQVEINERERTDAALRTNQKLQAVGQLAGGMAHEFNNLLTTVLGALELLRLRLGENPKLQGYVTSATDAAQRGSRLTSQMLAFARRRKLMPIAVDMNSVLVEMRELLDGTLGRGIALKLELANGLWPALADRHEIEAAILNLALNARDAMEQGGTLRLVTANRMIPVDDTAGGTGLAGDFVELSVADNGVGMTEEELAHSVDPFFTTKGPSQGAGLGLSQVHGMSQQLGGNLRLQSAKGIGTTATLLLPRAIMTPLTAAAAPAPAIEPYGPLLLVDDDDQVRQIAAEMLTEIGYEVTAASSGLQALSLLRQQGGFRALVADYSMPGMTGAEVIREARRLQPDLLTLLITGYMEFSNVKDAEALAAEEVLRKPFTLNELSRRIEELSRARSSEPV